MVLTSRVERAALIPGLRPRARELAVLVCASLCFVANCAKTDVDEGAGGGQAGQASGGSGGTNGGGGESASGGTTQGGKGGASNGTGGAAPSGGAGGSMAGGAGGNAAGNGAGGSAGATSGAVIFREDFEAATVGQQPSGWDNFISYVKNGQNPNGKVSALIDSTRAHGGTKSVRFAGGSQPAMLTRALPNGTNKLYVRAFFWMKRQLGMNPGANHETLIGIRKSVGGANDEVRFGEIKGAIGTNEVPSDNISPKQELWGKGPVIAANSWQCIEVAFLADEATHKLYAWNQDTMVHSITAPDQWNNGALNAAWMNGKFVELILGWHSFSGIDTELWMDDLVVSTARIGCPQ